MTDIITALVEAASDIGWVGKTGQNREQGYQFRGFDELARRIAPAFRDRGIIVTPEVVDRHVEAITSKSGTKGWHVILTVRWTFYHTSGSSVIATTVGEASDYSDKAANKAMTQAMKYVLTQVLLLPTDEPDPDEETPENNPDPIIWAKQEVLRLCDGDREKARETWERLVDGRDVTPDVALEVVEAMR